MAETGSSQIVGMMAVTAVFGVVGAEVRQAKEPNAPGAVNHFIADPFLVVAGATVATAILVALNEFGGEPGHTLGVGLAGLSLLTMALVQGGPVWGLLGNLFGSTGRKKATTSATTTTKKVTVA